MKATPYKISTITCVSSLNRPVDIKTLYEKCDVVAATQEANDEAKITYIEYGDTKFESNIRGEKPRRSKKKTETEEKKPDEVTQKGSGKPIKAARRFDNQITAIVRVASERFINMKLFSNGNIQMTGAKSVAEAEASVAAIRTMAATTGAFTTPTVRNKDDTNDLEIIVEPSPCVPALINANFSVNFHVKRGELFNILSNTYHIVASFEPCIYPGVKIMYYWNPENRHSGICNCAQHCDAKHGICKKITLAVFQSGNIIITGANDMRQLDDCHSFLCKLLRNHEKAVRSERPSPAPLNSSSRIKKGTTSYIVRRSVTNV